MATYINPGNQAFRRIAGVNYVDKTMLIEQINKRIGGEEMGLYGSRMKRVGWSLDSLWHRRESEAAGSG